MQVLPHYGSETIARSPGVKQVSILVVSKNERIKAFRSRSIPADYEFLTLVDAHLSPCSNALQNYGSSSVPIFYYVFDVLVLAGVDLMSEPLARRSDLLRRQILPKLKDPVRECPELNASLSDVVNAVRAQGLEGVVAKNLNSSYEPGRRSEGWAARVVEGHDLAVDNGLVRK